MHEDYLKEFQQEQDKVWTKHLFLVALVNLMIMQHTTYYRVEEGWDCWV